MLLLNWLDRRGQDVTRFPFVGACGWRRREHAWWLTWAPD